MESDSEEEGNGFNSRQEPDDTSSLLLEDQALPTTSRRQWREALMYNYGAMSLPEGEAARNEFDRIFQSFRSPRPYPNLANDIMR
jgi:hypothetical protein